MPKVFISYSWSSQTHQQLIKSWAEQLLSDGIDVVLDIFDLKEGHDKYIFMERMVNDSTISHVIIICDKIYSEKADSRKTGVGTETQIISKEVYEKVDQSKFIPIVCEFNEQGVPYLPTYLKSRIWIDFSSPEAVNKNWEQLVRVIYGKPLHEKPEIGKPPLYITSDTPIPTSHIQVKYNSLKQSILEEKSGLPLYRSDFLDACIEYADKLRVREDPNTSSLGEKVFDDVKKLKLVRNHIIDWVLLESKIINDEFSDSLINFLERMRELKSRPEELNSWNDEWFEAHSLFVYETFLYIVVALIKNQAYQALSEVFTTHYLIPKTARYGDTAFETFQAFYAHSDTLQSVFAPKGKTLYSPAGELIKRNADRNDLTLKSIFEADLLVLLMAFLIDDTRWFPQTLYYLSYAEGDFPLFLRGTQHKHFMKLAIITGIEDADELREKAKVGFERFRIMQRNNFYHHNIWSLLNMDKLDTLN